jgi:tetratricopeptide (TPR) repeat protein
MFAVVGHFGQKIEKPTLTAKPLTDHQLALIEEGIALHKQKKFDAAILKYELVLGENPDATGAMYEKALSLYTKGEKEKAIETAVLGSKYRSEELPLFYLVIANVIDDAGKPKEAVKIFRDAIKILEKEKDMDRHLSSVHFNLGVTYARQQLMAESRVELKKAVEYNPLYPSPHYVLSEIYGANYKVPALLAAMRFISLEYNTARTDRAVATVKRVLAPAEKDEKTGNINIFMNLDAPKDEGDFGMYDLLLGTLGFSKDDEDKGKTAEVIFAESIDTTISLLAGDKKLKSTFVGKQYVPYLAELKSRGFTQAFAYVVIFKSDNKNAAALKWLETNNGKLQEFLAWAKTYRPPVN